MSSLYIKLSIGFFSHRKTAKLRSWIGDDALWIMPRIWAYAAEHQPDGDFSTYSGDELAMLIGCPKHAPSMLEALIASGFFNSDLSIHDWETHNGFHKHFSDRAKNAANARWDKEKEKNQKKEREDKDKDIDKETSIASSMLVAFRVRVGNMLNRRESTAWSEKEMKALKAVFQLNTPEQDIVDLEKRYKSGDQYLRRDIITLLNNWNGEIDRAKRVEPPHTNGSHKPNGIPPWKQEKLLEEQILTHPANYEALKYDRSKVTPELKAELVELKTKLAEVRKLQTQ